MMGDTHRESLSILRHYFKLGLKTTIAALRIHTFEGNTKISDQTAQNWFKLFKKGHQTFEIKYRSRGSATANHEELKGNVEQNSPTVTPKLAR
ncbi:hypothetical protein AVEN_40416-1 [Araneus ventricosus]|uniref:Mos1 transposase HTH domain-containing protein n=1 Tax=Araneus ventricosus TaxID=182803 RepID=A0A4Y2DB74_ARAVE|nr:hypothetical protein AVEN_40416-1 [Araneus ventricosus]